MVISRYGERTEGLTCFGRDKDQSNRRRLIVQGLFRRLLRSFRLLSGEPVYGGAERAEDANVDDATWVGWLQRP